MAKQAAKSNARPNQQTVKIRSIPAIILTGTAICIAEPIRFIPATPDNTTFEDGTAFAEMENGWKWLPGEGNQGIFESAGDPAKNAPILIIRGEAFAETAIRRGNLWFTRARLEFTVTNAKGEVLKTDRIVCGNVDLAQAVGAKGALQKSGLLASTVVAKAVLESPEKNK